MSSVSMPDSERSPLEKIRIAVDIGQYHFVTWDGWTEEWETKTPREWYKKRQWLKEGGYNHEMQNHY